MSSFEHPVSPPIGPSVNIRGVKAFSVLRIVEHWTVVPKYGGHTVYQIAVKCDDYDESTHPTDMMGMGWGPSMPWFVYRRYSEFRKLNDTLRSDGCRVPILPPKKPFGNLDEEFVMSRQRELEIWLHRLVEAHEEVPGSVDPMHTPAMRLFMLDRANQPPPVQQKIVANNQLYIISEKLATAPAHPYAQNGHLASPQDNSDESEESGRTTSLAIGEDVDIEDENGVVPALANLSLATSQQGSTTSSQSSLMTVPQDSTLPPSIPEQAQATHSVSPQGQESVSDSSQASSISPGDTAAQQSTAQGQQTASGGDRVSVKIVKASDDSVSSAEGDHTAKAQQSAPEKTQVTLEDFEICRVIGKGSFGKVFLVTKRDTNAIYAMKVLRKDHVKRRRQIEHTKTERRVLGMVRHPFIVAMHFAFQSPQKLYFVLDYCPGGELFFWLSREKRLPEASTVFYSAEITAALEHLHSLGVVYRDLKPENVLLDKDGHVKLADFGLAKEGITDPDAGAYSLCGTPEYLAPEVLNKRGHGLASDWWNMGMVIYEMLTGLPPWYTTDRKKLFHRLRYASLEFPQGISPNAQDFISSLLIRDPTQRLGTMGAAQVKAHHFFASINWDKLLSKGYTPPLNPCKGQDITRALNFEREFRDLPMNSMAEEHNVFVRNERTESETFRNFSYDASVLSGDLPTTD